MPARNLPLTALIAMTLVIGLRPCARGDEPAAPPIPKSQPPDVATLIEQLADPRMLVRVAAERSLRERGPAVLPELPDPATLRPPAADAVRRIITHLQREQARAVLQPSRVRLGGEMPLSAALTAIGKQTGNALIFGHLPEAVRERALQFEFENVSFWEAIGEIERDADVVATSDPQQDAVVLRARSDVASPPLASTNDGPFRISVIRVREQMDFVDPDRRLLRTVLEVLVEPRLRPLFLHFSDAELHVSAADVDKDGDDNDAADPPAEELPPLSPTAKREISLDRPGPVRISHDAILPRGNLAPLLEAVDLRGRFEMELAAGQEQFEFRHLDEGGRITRRHGGVDVTLESLSHEDGTVEVQLRLRYDADGPRFESHRSWVFHNEVWLSTGEKKRLDPAEFETVSEGEGGAVLRYRFRGVEGISADTQLTYTAPTLFTRVPIKFELENVPANR